MYNKLVILPQKVYVFPPKNNKHTPSNRLIYRWLGQKVYVFDKNYTKMKSCYIMSDILLQKCTDFGREERMSNLRSAIPLCQWADSNLPDGIVPVSITIYNKV